MNQQELLPKGVIYAGVDDLDIDLFESQYDVPEGMSYNSYVITDDKTAVLDTVDARKADEWLDNIAKILNGKKPDYLVVHHMEPDHSGSIAKFIAKYPDTTLVASGKALNMLPLYFEDLKKIDPTGRLSNIYKAIPSQLALKKKHFVLSSAIGKRQTTKDESRFFELLDSKTVLCCYHVSNPDSALAQTKDLERFKLYASDTGLFISLMFDDSKQANEIYAKLLSDKLDADLGYLYENVAAQIITASGKELYYHTWLKENSSHHFEIDFLLSKGNKIIPLEIKSSATRNHESIENFVNKYSKKIYKEYLFSQKDAAHVGQLLLKPLYLLPFMLEEF